MINAIGRIDPTRTTMLRQRFCRAMRQRFNLLKARIIRKILEDNRFIPKPYDPFVFTYNVDESAKSIEFYRWLLAQIDQDIYDSRDDTQPNWTVEYLQSAYMKGQERSFSDLKKPLNQKKLDFYKGTRAEFLRSAFFRPVSIDRVKLLASRTLMEMGGATDAMAQQITRELVDGMISGESPKVVAARLAAKVEKIGLARAQTIARTETVRAHAEGQLDALEELGMDSVGIAVEWSTAGGLKVCQKCRSLEGVVLSLQEARGLLPRHPNCRCAFKPANVGEPSAGQKRSAKRINAAIKASLAAKDSWVGRKTRISRKRPRTLIKAKRR